MAIQLPPIPNNPITDVFVWRDWFYKVSQALVQQASIAWSSIDFTGSNLQDIQTRQHNALQNIQGGIASQYYHLSLAQYNSLSALTSLPITVPNGGTGATTLTGYVYGNGTSAFTASTTIPWSVITGAPSMTAPSYGAFQNTADQTYAAANTAYIITLNTTDYSNNVTLSSNKMTVSTTGTYNLEFSFQLANADSQIHEFAVWLRKNGTDVAGTSSIASVVSSHGSVDGYAIMAANFYIQMAAGDYVELWSAVSNTGIRIDAIPAQSSPYVRPLNPSSVVTLTQVA
jgi:hypothetical protein